MLRIIFVISSFLYVAQGWAQVDFSYGISLFPNYSDRRLISFSFLSQEDIFSLDSLERGRFSYSGGVFAQWRSEKVGFQTGVNFMNTGYGTIRETILAGDPDENLGNERSFVYRNFNIEVPAELHFYQEMSPGNEFIFTLGAALSYNIANDSYKIIHRDGGNDRTNISDPDQEFRAMNVAFITGVGWETALSESFSMVIQPTFEFWMRGLLPATLELNRNLYNIGVKVNFKFIQLYEEY